MKSICSLILFFLVSEICLLSTSFALSEEEYYYLKSTYSEYRDAEKELNHIWKQIKPHLKTNKNILNDQQKWVNKGRDIIANKYISEGYTRSEAYIKATLDRVDELNKEYKTIKDRYELNIEKQNRQSLFEQNTNLNEYVSENNLSQYLNVLKQNKSYAYESIDTCLKNGIDKCIIYTKEMIKNLLDEQTEKEQVIALYYALVCKLITESSIIKEKYKDKVVPSNKESYVKQSILNRNYITASFLYSLNDDDIQKLKKEASAIITSCIKEKEKNDIFKERITEIDE